MCQQEESYSSLSRDPGLVCCQIHPGDVIASLSGERRSNVKTIEHEFEGVKDDLQLGVISDTDAMSKEIFEITEVNTQVLY